MVVPSVTSAGDLSVVQAVTWKGKTIFELISIRHFFHHLNSKQINLITALGPDSDLSRTQSDAAVGLDISASFGRANIAVTINQLEVAHHPSVHVR